MEESLRVNVEPGKIEKALSVLKRKMQGEGIFREMRRREFYEKPSEQRRRKHAEALRRHRKAERKRAERDG